MKLRKNKKSKVRRKRRIKPKAKRIRPRRKARLKKKKAGPKKKIGRRTKLTKKRSRPKKSKPRKKAKKSGARTTNRGGARVYYGLNPKFEFLNELKNLMLTSPPASLSNMAKRISALGRIKLTLVSGVFLNKENVADLLIVGDDVDRRKFKNFLKTLEAEVGTQIIYAIMDKEEFNYRRAMFDRFVRLMLEGPHEILIDKIGL